MRAERKYFGNTGHFICGDKCQFHLCTLIGDVLVSTVGELWLERGSREIHAKIYDPEWLAANRHLKGDDFDFAYRKKFGFEEVGCDRKYETMAFKVNGKVCPCGCGIPSIIPSEIEFAAYNDAKAATEGHERICLKVERAAKRRSAKSSKALRSLRCQGAANNG